jgi:hypothetical protein
MRRQKPWKAWVGLSRRERGHMSSIGVGTDEGRVGQMSEVHGPVFGGNIKVISPL